MLRKITEIKNFGIFKDFCWNTDLDEFKKYNLIYGWNGSGKSTFARLIKTFENGEISASHVDSKFRMETEKGEFSERDFKDYDTPIFVFNDEFIQENIDWDNTVEKILLVSDQKINERKKLSYLQLDQKEFRTKINNIIVENKELGKRADKILQEVAKQIKLSLQVIETDQQYYYNYNKGTLKRLIDRYEQEIKQQTYLLKESDAEKLLIASKPNFKNLISQININADFNIFKKKYDEIIEILNKQIFIKTIDQLKDNVKLSNWVEEGLEIHKGKTECICEFCKNSIDSQRLSDLENHFNANFRIVKESAMMAITSIAQLKLDIDSLPDENQFYDEFKEDYCKHKDDLIKLTTKINNSLDVWIEELNKKYNNPIEKIETIEFIEHNDIILFTKTVKSISKIINYHNEKSNNFNESIKRARNSLELHYATELLILKEYFLEIEKIFYNYEKIKSFDASLILVNNEIKKVEDELYSETLGATELTEKLHKFIGHRDITLKYSNEKKGYMIFRGEDSENPAKNLSEGEKSALALIYFITKLNEERFNIQESIIVIDDPVSSFDSRNLYNSFSYIRKAFNESKQLIILTHNFAYFKLVRDWMKTKKKKGTGELKFSCYCIETNYEECRSSKLVKAHKSIVEFETEYHYTFKKLHDFRGYETLNIDQVHLVANLSRKLLESFLSFKYPDKRSNFRELLVNAYESEEMAERVYRFINKYSHHQYFEFDDTTSDNLLGESTQILNEVIFAIESNDLRHYEEMKAAIEVK